MAWKWMASVFKRMQYGTIQTSGWFDGSAGGAQD
jgi:hypothetical protein